MILLFLCNYVFSAVETPSIDVQAFKLSHSFDTILLEEALNPYSEYTKRGSLLVGFGGHYSNNLLSIFNKSDSKTDSTIVKDIIGLDLHIGFLMMKKRLYLGVSGSFSKITLDTVPPTYSGEKSGWSINDPKILAKIRLTPNTSRVSLALIPYMQIKAGKPEYYVTDNSLSGGAKLALDYYQDNFYINTNIGYQYSPESFLPEAYFTGTDGLLETSLKHRMFGGLGFGYFLTQKFSLHSELYGFISFPIEVKYFSIDWILYGRLKIINNLGLFLGASFKGIQDYTEKGIAKASKRINWRVFGAIRWFLNKEKEVVQAPKIEAPAPVLATPQQIEPVAVLAKAEDKLLGEVFFATNKYDLNNVEQAKLLKIVNNINQSYVGRKLYLEGHTDSRGSSAHHGPLSFNRAKAVENFLRSSGVTNEIIVRANAIPKLLVREDLATGSGLSQNRSVEIYVEN